MPVVSLCADAMPAQRALARTFGKAVIDPVGSLSGLGGAAAGLGGSGDEPGLDAAAFASGGFVSGADEAASPVVPPDEAADESG